MLIPGTTVALGGEEFIVPPLSLSQVRAFLPRVQQVSGLHPADMGSAQLEALVEIITAALQRNYPDLTKERVEEIVDFGNALPVLDAILGGGKLPRAEPNPTGDSAAVGELSGFQGNEPAASDPQPGGIKRPAAAPYEPGYPWRANPPVVGS